MLRIRRASLEQASRCGLGVSCRRFALWGLGCAALSAPVTFFATKARVLNRGVPPDEFLRELLEWGRKAPAEIFARNLIKGDIYDKVAPELGPWNGSDLARRAAMLEVMRVLAGFESSWDWKEGVDTSRLGADTPENAEAGAWQVSYDARALSPELATLLRNNGIRNGLEFQREMKHNHALAMEFIARLMRFNTKHNGPLYKGEERLAIRKSLRGAENSIYPWLSRASMEEFATLLA